MDASKYDIQPANSFTDVDTNAWYAKAVTYLAENNVLSGYADGTFRPNTPITRAEMVQISSMFEGIDFSNSGVFTDVPTQHWASNSISSFQGKGWIVGYDNSTFRPEDYASREEIVTIVNSVLDRSAMDYRLHEDLHSWTDLSSGRWSYNAVMEASHSHNCEHEHEQNKWIEIWTRILGTGIHAPFNQ